MSESLASGLFFRRVQSLPYENAVRGTALSSLQIKRPPNSTVVGSEGTEPEPEEKGAMQRNTDSCSG